LKSALKTKLQSVSFAIGIFALLLVFWFLLVYQSSSFNKCCNDYYCEYETQAKDKKVSISGVVWANCICSAEFLDIHNGSVAAFATIVIAGFTVLLWRSTHKMWKATKDTAQAALKTAEALPTIEKAYLFVDVELRQHEQFKRWEVIIKIYNGGKTPAIDLQGYADFIESSVCPININEANSIRLTKGNIMKAGEEHIEPVAGPASWTIPDAEQLINSPNKNSICYGRVDYRDIFEKAHSVYFCWHHDSEAVGEGFYFRRCDNKKANRRT